MYALVDLHVHSWASPCSRLTPGVVGREAVARGLGGIAVVDHDRFPDPGFLVAVRHFGIRVYAGVEIATRDGDLLACGISDLPETGLFGMEVAGWVWEQGGAAVVAHPFRLSRPASQELLAHPTVVIEERNGRCNDHENHLAWLSRLSRGSAGAGGSDAHEPGEVGRVATVFPSLPADERELVHWLRAGRCTAWSPHVLSRESADLSPFPLAV